MINIKLTTRKNNFFLTASNEKKNLIFQSTGGQEKFKGKQKKTDTAFAAALFKLFLKITKQKKNDSISFITKGFMAWPKKYENDFKFFFKEYKKFKNLPKIELFFDITPIQHGGCLAKKPRRL